MGQQVLALCGTPLDSGLVDFLIVFAFSDFFHQVLRYIDAEGARQHFDMSVSGNGF